MDIEGKGMKEMPGALTGIQILDLSRVLAGPYCTMILGDLGAQVIKVEATGGSDETRKWGPPFQEGVSAYYVSVNRNKQSITVDLKTPKGIATIKKLAAESDVVVSNFKTGTMERLGLSYATLSAINPQIVYCSITGFGETGPDRHLPGYDFIIQAMSGLMSITGTEDSGPQKVGVAITDILTGLYACIGIQAALLERVNSGVGQKLELSLYDTAVSALVNVGSNYLMDGKVPAPLGNTHPNIVPYQTFQTADGEIVIAVGTDLQFRALCHMLKKADYAKDPRYISNAKRVEHRDSLVAIVQQVLRKEKTAHWQQLCREYAIPAGPIQTVAEIFHDKQLQARGMFVEQDHPTAGKIKLIGSPLKLSRTPVSMTRHPPNAGEHNEELLGRFQTQQSIKK